MILNGPICCLFKEFCRLDNYKHVIVFIIFFIISFSTQKIFVLIVFILMYKNSAARNVHSVFQLVSESLTKSVRLLGTMKLISGIADIDVLFMTGPAAVCPDIMQDRPLFYFSFGSKLCKTLR